MIFISSPYSHGDKNVVQERFVETCKYAAYLVAQKKTAVSPVIIGHNLLGHEKLPSDFNFWKDYSYELLANCKELHVLALNCWEESEGVKHEMSFAREHNIPIYFVIVTGIETDKYLISR